MKSQLPWMIAAVGLFSTGCRKTADPVAACYKVHALVLSGEMMLNTETYMDAFEALKRNTPEGREDAMMILGFMVKMYPDKMALLKKPPYEFKGTEPTDMKVQKFLQENEDLIRRFRESSQARADAHNSQIKPQIQRRSLNEIPKTK